MKLYWFDSVFGAFVIDDEGKLVGHALHEDPQVDFQAVVADLEVGEVPAKYSELLSRLRTLGDVVISCEDESVAGTLESANLRTIVESPSPARPKFYENFDRLYEEAGGSVESRTTDDVLFSTTRAWTEEGIRQLLQRADLSLIQAIQALDEVQRTLNLFAERLREWYGLHFPELTDSLISNNVLFARMVWVLRDRDGFTGQALKEHFNLPDRVIETIVDRRDKSMGVKLSVADEKAVQRFAKEVLALEHLQGYLKKHVEQGVNRIAPNVTAIVGPLIAARLIALAGGLEKLAKMPASRMQVLGAERALFRSLRSDHATPKHGVIFQWAPLRGAKKWQRGKIARALAGKLAIAARVDFFQGNFVGDALREAVLLKVRKIQKTFPDPPSSKRTPPSKGERGRPSRQKRGGRPSRPGRPVQGRRQSKKFRKKEGRR
ncbi:MAG: Pre-mRNA processing ribonucleoprotein,-binding region [Promethearchaeota archaeon]